MSGTTAEKAGWKSAWPSPYTTTSAITCHSSAVSASASAAMAAMAAQRSRSAAIIRRRRSKRSLSTPEIRSDTTIGSVHARPTSPSAVGSFEMSSTSHAIATR